MFLGAGFLKTKIYSVMMVGLDKDLILNSLEILREQKRGDQRDLKLVKEYDVDNVSKKIVRIIQSYTSYINRLVWKKY